MQQALVVKSKNSSYRLHPMLRINYAVNYQIESDLKVYELGKVDSRDVDSLVHIWNQINLKDDRLDTLMMNFRCD